MKCKVVLPHVRKIAGQLTMFEPMLSGIVDVPNDEDTRGLVEAGYLELISDSELTDESGG